MSPAVCRRLFSAATAWAAEDENKLGCLSQASHTRSGERKGIAYPETNCEWFRYSCMRYESGIGSMVAGFPSGPLYVKLRTHPRFSKSFTMRLPPTSTELGNGRNCRRRFTFTSAFRTFALLR